MESARLLRTDLGAHILNSLRIIEYTRGLPAVAHIDEDTLGMCTINGTSHERGEDFVEFRHLPESQPVLSSVVQVRTYTSGRHS